VPSSTAPRPPERPSTPVHAVEHHYLLTRRHPTGPSTPEPIGAASSTCRSAHPRLVTKRRPSGRCGQYQKVDLDGVASELYQVPPSAFTAARDAKAAEALGSGDRALARQIKGLRRPTVAAWATNLLAHRRPTKLHEIVDLGASLRHAQETLAGDELRRLSRRRSELIGTLAEEAGNLAAEAGQPLSEAARADVEESLEAALVDDEAGKTLLAGHITRPLQLANLATMALGDGVPTDTGRKHRSGQVRPDSETRELRKVAEATQREREKAEREWQRVEEKLARAVELVERLREADGKARRRLRDAQAAERAAVRRLRLR
jgi:hypothetical protein